MASIIKRKNSFAVVYSYIDEFGNKKQKWETYKTEAEAKKRRSEIEVSQEVGSLILPKKITVCELLNDYVNLYGKKKWGITRYDSCISLINNYINPIIGEKQVQSITPRFVDDFITSLEKTQAVWTNNRKPKGEYITPNTIERIIKLLRQVFDQAVHWEVIVRNPFKKATLPKIEKGVRDIWTSDVIKKALDNCTDNRLYIALNLAFACSLRLGEILGLTWDNVDISDEAVTCDNAYIYIKSELGRVSFNTMQKLDNRGIQFVFPPIMEKATTRIVLREPKTKSSIRKIWLPKTLAYILIEWKKAQDDLKLFFGNEYEDYNLVVALPNGRPCENRIIEKSFNKLKEKAELPDVVFHSLRHSSTTYKLKLNNGDIKATQGDTGHATADMIMKVYAHILDEDRKVNAQKFENAFYNNIDLRKVEVPKQETSPSNNDLSYLIEELEKSPELVKKLTLLMKPRK